LRAHGKSYVCDVNGFSFVKNSTKYYDDCSSILANSILKEIGPAKNIPYQLISYQAEDS
jgi:inositol hexakisphosphate/diphosphoinositol-pentakisphosphate kinase